MFLLRISLGWLFLHAGYVKIINPNWSAAGYLKSAKTFPAFYQWLASDSMIGITNFLNEWGLAILGICLILGLGTRIVAVLAALMMILYYFPILTFPTIGANSYIVDEHIIYAAAFLLLGALRAGRHFGLDSKLPERYSWLG